jgi:hypothetical protein
VNDVVPRLEAEPADAVEMYPLSVVVEYLTVISVVAQGGKRKYQQQRKNNRQSSQHVNIPLQ